MNDNFTIWCRNTVHRWTEVACFLLRKQSGLEFEQQLSTDTSFKAFDHILIYAANMGDHIDFFQANFTTTMIDHELHK